MVDKEKIKKTTRNKKTENSIVAMENRLIISRWHTNLIETKLVLYVISVFNSLQGAQTEYKIPVRPFLNATSLGEDYNLIKTITRNLSREILEVPKTNEQGKKVYTYYPLFSKTEYVEGKGYILTKINPETQPYLFNLNREFTTFYLKNVVNIGSMYSIRLYELLKQYEQYKSRKFTISELRELLVIEPNEYKLFADFEKWVIKKSVTEINKKTDLLINYQKNKKGRIIESILFEIDKNPNKNIKSFDEFFDEEEKKEKGEEEKLQQNEKKVNNLKELVALLPELERTKHSQNVLSKYLNNYNAEYIAKQIEYTNNQKPKSYFAYLTRAIENDYANSEKAELEKKRIQENIEYELKQAKEEVEHNILVAVDKEKFRIFEEYMGLLDENEKQELFTKYKLIAKQKDSTLKDGTGALEFAIERLITEDIIAENKIYQTRLEKVKERAIVEAKKEFKHLKYGVLMKYCQINPSVSKQI